MLIRSNPTNYQRNHAHLGRVSAVVSKSRGRGGLGSITKSHSKNKTTKNTADLPSRQDTRKSLFTLKNQSGSLLQGHRVNSCLCNRCNLDAPVGVKVSTYKNADTTTRKATFKNLFRCDSVWVCPVCGQRILAQRGKEIEQAIQMIEYKGGSVFMLTLTHSHQLGEDLKDKLARMGKALTRFFGDRVMREVFEKCGLIGHIKALEFTHSFKNGWHPHNHILMFSKFAPHQFLSMQVPVTFDKNGFIQLVTAKRYKMLKKRGLLSSMTHVTIEQFIKHYWRKCCLVAGLGEPNYERGATLQNADKAKSYLTKFKTAQEMTSQAKVAKSGSRNQWQLLSDSLNGDAYASHLFQEYAVATKHQRQLVWSRGLKEFFEIEQVEDANCEVPDEDDETLVREDEVYFHDEQWYFIRRNRLQPEVLNIAEKHGIEVLKEYIEKIPITAIPVIDDASLAVMRL